MAGEELINLNSLLHCLVKCSEKASSIAQICRKDKELFQLLVEEKKESEKNQRFVQDFKTLADVFIQEAVRWEVSKKFPAIKSNIFGEENSCFKNVLGKEIRVQVLDSVDETVSLLSEVLDGKDTAARALANSVYEDIQVDVQSKTPGIYLSADKIGIWIDPIDSTGEYVHAKSDMKITNAVNQTGLKCVCVLIGAFNLDTGFPILGVINQPFYSLNSNTEWISMRYWATCCDGYLETSIPKIVTNAARKKIVASNCEDEHFLNLLRSKYEVQFVSGAGYKCLVVARGEADLYVLSLPTTFFWDTCGPQAILMGCGGSIIDFKETLSMENLCEDDLKTLQLKYSVNRITKPVFCNSNGIIAYKESSIILEFAEYLHANCYAIK